MAATPAQQRRYQAALRRVLKEFREDPTTAALYKERLTAALADYDASHQDG